MLFNSHLFIFVFLPVCLFGYFLLGARQKTEAAMAWLVVCSLFFYGWWKPVYMLLIGFSILFNYGYGHLLAKSPLQRPWALALGVGTNLALLGWFKYANFTVDTVNQLAGTAWHLETIILPLAISFFTFQQIAYLIDTHRGETREYNFMHYCLFVTFFPQLIAGPIVHHKEMLPQFMLPGALKPRYRNLAIGLSIFLLGLFKKTVLADSIAVYATPVFAGAEQGLSITFLEAWGGALAYTLQLYFDFSGYSDMAIGLGWLFGIRLPMNFFSPYQSRNIIEFWRRWHITLSRFLRDYLYFSLGGNRKGNLKRYRNLFLTMLLGGLWHGAAWTFVFWGAMHGGYLIINHGWHALRRASGGIDRLSTTRLFSLFSWLLTFVAVVIAWVFFRASSFDSALNILAGMAGLNGVMLDADAQGWIRFFTAIGMQVEISGYATRFVEATTLHWIVGLLGLALFAPNVYQLFHREKPVFDVYAFSELSRTRLCWQPNLRWSLLIAVLGVIALVNMNKVSEFLYFQF